MGNMPVTTGTDWTWPPAWPDTLRDCSGCERLLQLLVWGWGVRSGDREPLSWERLQWKGERLRIWDNWYKARRLPTVGGGSTKRALSPLDDRETWAAANTHDRYPGEGVPDEVIEQVFPEPDDGRGRDRLHPHIEPATVAGMVDRVSEVLEHLEDLPTEELEDHFTATFGEEWPPHLDDVHDVLVEWWDRYDAHPIPGQRKKNRRGVALRVATVLPLQGRVVEGDGEGPVEFKDEELRVEFERCDLTYQQLRPMLDRAE